MPTVGGSVGFHRRYDGNILVNAMAVGLARADAIFYAAATGVGNPIVYLGSKTGRDGIHGATMASAAFDDASEEKRPTVQVGDPFAEKLLLEACLELMASGAVIAIQDMGAAGLTCSAVEMGAKGNLGVELNLDAVPTREPGMTAYEMMLSESQERMLMVLKPGMEAEAQAIFVKWGLDFAIIGHTTDTLRFVIKHGGETVADLPIKELGDEAPLYDRPHRANTRPSVLKAEDVAAPVRHVDALKTLVASPDLSSKRWVWEQYDHFILGNTVQKPAATPRWCGSRTAEGAGHDHRRDPALLRGRPVEGGKQAVAEAWRNITAVGGRPLAVTDNLNFGNPEKPEVMGQLVGCLRASARRAGRSTSRSSRATCRSTTRPTASASCRPDHRRRRRGRRRDADRDARPQARGRRAGPDRSDAGLARAVGLPRGDLRPRGWAPRPRSTSRSSAGTATSCAGSSCRASSTPSTTSSDGGLAVALAEMAMAGGIGAALPDCPFAIPLPRLPCSARTRAATCSRSIPRRAGPALQRLGPGHRRGGSGPVTGSDS